MTSPPSSFSEAISGWVFCHLWPRGLTQSFFLFLCSSASSPPPNPQAHTTWSVPAPHLQTQALCREGLPQFHGYRRGWSPGGWLPAVLLFTGHPPGLATLCHKADSALLCRAKARPVSWAGSHTAQCLASSALDALAWGCLGREQ